jgi:hypothetical protein
MLDNMISERPTYHARDLAPVSCRGLPSEAVSRSRQEGNTVQ